ncbi:uncharacterized protein LY79DRAFT_575282 [Colletotrichum navitas]|uniref:Uncharacterized protein n=1 Tax=Colletotrichum navitas TaxID=681940 RepID=A0AAD8QE31_9PEZI|nr:uncharacterized protein LY79DRAFT_575282 [Colletotrichum navitas]KAK1599623.1 hypothetical protein LY79DRAFT_575282 [Colletotrichum navitas]
MADENCVSGSDAGRSFYGPRALGMQSCSGISAILTFDELFISGGNAHTAKEDALAKLGGLPADLSTVDKADLTFLDSVNKTANQAERGRLRRLQAEQAQGKNVTAQLEEETKKLEKSVADDVANAGEPATALKFDASIDNPAASEVPKYDAVAAKAGDVIS